MTNPEEPEEASVEAPEESVEAPVEAPATESASGVEAPVEAPATTIGRASPKSASGIKAPRTQKQLDVLAKARVKAAETIKARKASREALRNKPPVFPEGASIRSESQPVFPVGASIRSESPPVLSEEESPVHIISQRAHRQDMKKSVTTIGKSVTMSREELDQLLEESSTRTYNKLKIIDAPQPKLIYNYELGVYTYQA